MRRTKISNSLEATENDRLWHARVGGKGMVKNVNEADLRLCSFQIITSPPTRRLIDD
jgi:hypothetical protein